MYVETTTSFRITDICSQVSGIRGNENGIQIDVQNVDQRLTTDALIADDIANLIEALQEAYRLVKGGEKIVTPAPADIPAGFSLGLQDDEGDVWMACANGKFVLDGETRPRDYVEKFYGPLTEVYAG